MQLLIKFKHDISNFEIFYIDKYDILVSLKSFINSYQQNTFIRVANESALRAREAALRDAHARVSTALGVRSAIQK